MNIIHEISVDLIDFQEFDLIPLIITISFQISMRRNCLPFEVLITNPQWNYQILLRAFNYVGIYWKIFLWRTTKEIICPWDILMVSSNGVISGKLSNLELFPKSIAIVGIHAMLKVVTTFSWLSSLLPDVIAWTSVS